MARNSGDPWLAERIAEVVAKYEDVLLPEELAWVTQQMVELFTDDERCAALLRRARPKPEAEAAPLVQRSAVCRAVDFLGLRWAEKEPDHWVCKMGRSTFELLIVLGAAFFALREGDDVHAVVHLGRARAVHALLKRCSLPRVALPLN